MHSRYVVIRRSSIVCAICNLFLSACQIVVGVIFSSSALIADGLHSLSDLLSDFFIFLAAKFANKPPDDEHQYGHKRFETIAALFSALVLVLVAGIIMWEAIMHLHAGEHNTSTSLAVILMAAYSILQNELLYRYVMGQAKSINSTLLETAALHQRADALSSFVVLISAAGMFLGYDFLDSVGAVLIGLMVLRMAMGMLYQAANELLDLGVSPQEVAMIRLLVQTVDHVEHISRIRTRMVASEVMVEISLCMAENTSLRDVQKAKDEIRKRLMQISTMTVAEVVLDVSPSA